MMTERPKILVVDDEETVRNLLQRILKGEGYEVVTAADGADAMGLVSNGDINIVLIDIKMPGMSGIDVLSRLSAAWPEVCVIMVSAVVETQTAIEAMKMGAYDYIIKPFDQKEVLHKVQQAQMKWDRQMQERQQHVQLKDNIEEQTKKIQTHFSELVGSLAREHKLLRQLEAKKNGRSLLSELPPELQEPMDSVEEFRDALLRILGRS
jgi:DNA-binding NtrC family response regulator